ncbi:MAG: hypothetical protein MUC66_06915 [Methanolinea sp.]|nr:hypothetical protein [Methanolinea sp.]
MTGSGFMTIPLAQGVGCMGSGEVATSCTRMRISPWFFLACIIPYTRFFPE